MPPQLREIGFHVENYATQWHRFQHEIKNREIVVAWIQLTLIYMAWKANVQMFRSRICSPPLQVSRLQKLYLFFSS